MMSWQKLKISSLTRKTLDNDTSSNEFTFTLDGGSTQANWSVSRNESEVSNFLSTCGEEACYDDIATLQNTLQSAIDKLEPSLMTTLLDFVQDSGNESVVTKMQLRHLTDTVWQLNNHITNVDKRINSMESQLSETISLLKNLTAKSDSSVKNSSINVNNNINNGNKISTPLGTITTVTSTTAIITHSAVNVAPTDNIKTDESVAIASDAGNDEDLNSKVQSSIANGSINQAASPRAVNYLRDITVYSSDRSISDSLSDMSDSENEEEPAVDDEGRAATAIEGVVYDTTLTQKKQKKSAAAAAALTLDPVEERVIIETANTLVSCEKITMKYTDEVAMQVLHSISCNEQAFQERLNALAILRKQIRFSVNCSLIECGLHELGCNLPDDPVNCFLLLSKNHFPTWQTSLCERLGYVAETPEALIEFNDTTPVPDTKIEDVYYIKEGENSFKVFCDINSLHFEIATNHRTSLCFFGFLDEVAKLIDRSNLFKTSLLLIRAWWLQEAASLVGRNFRNYISDSVIALMICSIFNRFHHRIVTPLQALCYFVAEYSMFDPTRHLITLQGLAMYTNMNGICTAQLIPQDPRFLIPPQMMEKYCHLFGAGVSLPNDPHNQHIFTSQMGYDFNMKNGGNSANGVIAIENFGFNVLNPFNQKPMHTMKMSTKRLTFLCEALRGGAKILLAFLQQHESISTHDFVHSVFNSTLKTYQKEGQPQYNIRPVYDLPLMNYSIDKLWQNILYCNFVLESVVTESAILTASIENLSIKGPLPVGEVGKALTEISGMSQLSLHLKEKFGGLKKFLEKFPEIFVFSNDHPFNPHVLLRSELSMEHQKIIYRGVIPMQIMTTYKKGAQAKKNKALTSGETSLASLNPDKIASFVPSNFKLPNGMDTPPYNSNSSVASAHGPTLSANAPPFTMNPHQQQQQPPSYSNRPPINSNSAMGYGGNNMNNMPMNSLSMNMNMKGGMPGGNSMNPRMGNNYPGNNAAFMNAPSNSSFPHRGPHNSANSALGGGGNSHISPNSALSAGNMYGGVGVGVGGGGGNNIPGHSHGHGHGHGNSALGVGMNMGGGVSGLRGGNSSSNALYEGSAGVGGGGGVGGGYSGNSALFNKYNNSASAGGVGVGNSLSGMSANSALGGNKRVSSSFLENTGSNGSGYDMFHGHNALDSSSVGGVGSSWLGQGQGHSQGHSQGHGGHSQGQGHHSQGHGFDDHGSSSGLLYSSNNGNGNNTSSSNIDLYRTNDSNNTNSFLDK